MLCILAATLVVAKSCEQKHHTKSLKLVELQIIIFLVNIYAQMQVCTHAYVCAHMYVHVPKHTQTRTH